MNVGILGGGQLARMLAQAGRPLGLSFMFLCPDSNACAAPYGELLCAPYDDERAQNRLIKWADVTTYEFENIPLSVVESIQRQVTLHPSFSALAVARDRLVEKQRFAAMGIPIEKYSPINSLPELKAALQNIGLPAILKTRTQGYDGKGQFKLTKESDLSVAWDRLGKKPCIVEAVVPFKRELSIIAARDQNGQMVYYPVSENHHRDGILRLSIIRLNDSLQTKVNQMIKIIMDDFNYVGVMALELFQDKDRLLANELAPRVHNSGHWSIEAARTSQFENHLRAICGLPLGESSTDQLAAMVNLVGNLPKEEHIRNISGATPHFYGKAERPGRKVGHITLTSSNGSTDEFYKQLATLLQITGESKLAGQKL